MAASLDVMNCGIRVMPGGAGVMGSSAGVETGGVVMTGMRSNMMTGMMSNMMTGMMSNMMSGMMSNFIIHIIMPRPHHCIDHVHRD